MWKITLLIILAMLIASSRGEPRAKKETSSIFYQRLFIEKTTPVHRTEEAKEGSSNEGNEDDFALSSNIPSHTLPDETGSWLQDSVVFSRVYFKHSSKEAEHDQQSDNILNHRFNGKEKIVDRMSNRLGNEGKSISEVPSPQDKNLHAFGTIGTEEPLDNSNKNLYKITESGNTMTINKIRSGDIGVPSGEKSATEAEDISGVVQSKSRRYRIIGEGHTLTEKDGKWHWLESTNETEAESGVLKTPPMDIDALKKAFLKLTKSRAQGEKIKNFKTRILNSENLHTSNITVNDNAPRAHDVTSNSDVKFSEDRKRTFKAKSKTYKVVGEGRTLAVKNGKAYWVEGNATEANGDLPYFDNGSQRGFWEDSLIFEPMTINNITELVKQRLFEALKKRFQELLSGVRKRENRKSKNLEHPN